MYDPSEEIIGYGKEIAYCDTVDGSYTPVLGTIEVNLPERELGKSETTNDGSPDYHKSYIPGLYEPGTISFTYRYGKTQFAALEDIFQLASVAGTRADATKYWKITLPDESTAVFKGFLTKHSLPLNVEDSPVVECELQVNGKIDFTAGGGS